MDYLGDADAGTCWRTLRVAEYCTAIQGGLFGDLRARQYRRRYGRPQVCGIRHPYL